MKDPEIFRDDEDWHADWQGHQRWQLTAGLDATPAQRLDWLEEMIEIAHSCGALAGRNSERDR